MAITTHSRRAVERRLSACCPPLYNGLRRSVWNDDALSRAVLEGSHSPLRTYDPNRLIYAQGDPSDHIYMLLSGWVAQYCELADGRRQITRFLLPSALFGSEAPGQNFGHSAIAVTTAVVCPTARSRFDRLRRQNPSLNERFIQLLEEDYRYAIRALGVVAQGTARERVGSLLGGLAAAAGESPMRAGDRVSMPLTQRLIAEATGLSAVHVNKVLRRLREDRTIDLRHGVLAVLNPIRLQALMQWSLD